ncbi:MAG TPA: cupredoxin domain-containing protein [Actinomycetota bacterium]|nr:cupredoxin domain-containing protein [Actinomycetota bacterium]
MSDGKNRQSLLLPILIPVGALVVIALVLIGFSRVLLAISHNAATVVALVAAAGIVGVAAWVASRKRVTGSTLFSMVAAMTGIAMVAGGLAVVAAPLQHGGEEEPGVVVALAAPEGAATEGFSTDTLSVPSDEAFTIEFNNADPGVPHNVVIFDGPDAESPSLFAGAVVTGPAKPQYAVEPLPEGEYFFNCEIHPTTMTGTMTAAPGGGEGGGGEGVTVAAAALEFDTDTIELPADTPTTITFDNQEAGTPHNIAIYADDSLGEELFKGELVTGPVTVPYDVPALPEGEYFFQCDVHPTMSGTVVVAAGGGGGAEPPPDEGGGGEEPPPDEGGGGTTATASVAAENTAFTPAALSWAADTQVALTFDNRDPADVAGPHNVSIYDGDAAVFQGDLVSGPETFEYTVPPMQAGTFEFRCDVHPEMIGTVEVT